MQSLTSKSNVKSAMQTTALQNQSVAAATRNLILTQTTPKTSTASTSETPANAITEKVQFFKQTTSYGQKNRTTTKIQTSINSLLTKVQNLIATSTEHTLISRSGSTSNLPQLITATADDAEKTKILALSTASKFSLRKNLV